jgi:hypothetical protein
MPTLFHQRFEARVQPANERAFGVSVTLRSAGIESAAFTATYDDQEYESIEHETGLRVKTVCRDWFLPVSSLVIGGETVEPVAGMFIVEGSDEYEILPIPGKPPAELQPGGYRWLVHTKRITADV